MGRGAYGLVRSEIVGFRSSFSISCIWMKGSCYRVKVQFFLGEYVILDVGRWLWLLIKLLVVLWVGWVQKYTWERLVIGYLWLSLNVVMKLHMKLMCDVLCGVCFLLSYFCEWESSIGCLMMNTVVVSLSYISWKGKLIVSLVG